MSVDEESGPVDVPVAPGVPALVRAALDAALDAFALVSVVRDALGQVVDFRVEYVNDTGARLAGRSAPALVGRSLREVTLGPVDVALMHGYLDVLSGGVPLPAETTDPVTGTVWEYRVAPAAPDTLAWSYRDISTRVRNQVRLAASEARAQHAVARISALQRVTATLSGAVSTRDVLSVIGTETLPTTGGYGVAVLLVGDDELRLRQHSGFPADLVRGLDRMPVHARHPLTAPLQRRAPLFLAAEQVRAGYPEHPDLAGWEASGAWAVLPLVSTGRCVGVLLVGYHQPAGFDGEDRAVLLALAELYGQALERATLFEAQKSIATDLQRALLPAALPVVAGARYAARYLPSTEGADVGGDWYDVIPLGEDTIGVVIGDVAGHSTRAAAVMGQLRNALRAYALEQHSPSGVLNRANRLLLRLEPGTMATCCYLEMHVQEGTVTGVLAGHLPPVQRVDADVRQLELRLGPPLGVQDEPTFLETTRLLPPGSSLLLFTDGLIEDRRYDIERGLKELSAAVAAAPPRGPDELLDFVLAAGVGPQPRTDDVALLAVTVDGPAAGGAASAVRRFHGDARSVSAARRFATDLLRAWRLDALTDSTALLLGEVMSNAVQHTVGDVRVRLVRDAARLRVEVGDSSDRRPDRQVGDLEAESGRGLLIVETLADAWGHRPTEAGGKIVWFELALPSAPDGAAQR